MKTLRVVSNAAARPASWEKRVRFVSILIRVFAMETFKSQSSRNATESHLRGS